MNTTGERLIYVRKLRGYSTQAELADAIGVTRGVIANIETDRYSTQEIVYNAICSTLNINKKWLLTGNGPMEPKNERSEILDELYKVCADLTESQQLYLLDTIKAMQKHLNPPQEKEAEKHTQSVDSIIKDAEARTGR